MEGSIRRWLLVAALAAGTIVSLLATATATAMDGCQPIANGDYVHESSGQASGHAWWMKGTCSDVAAQVGIVLWGALDF